MEILKEALGESDTFIQFQQDLSRVAPVERPVILIGERGTGKELAARRLHYLSQRWENRLVAVNCAALAPSLLESELFGHEAGAFTGAARRRFGRFELADGGTLFLDELGQVPMEVQEKILRVVEYGEFERVGSSEPVEVDVRLVAATHADLPALVRKGKFKADLLDRLSFEVLQLPPLRERQGDIPLLTQRFAAGMAQELGWESPPDFSDDVWASLEHHSWPGNIRELKNTVERAVYRSDGSRVSAVTFDPFTVKTGADAQTEPEEVPKTLFPEPEGQFDGAGLDLRKAVETFERKAVTHALEACRHNQAAAARFLRLGYHQFRGLYRKYASHKGA